MQKWTAILIVALLLHAVGSVLPAGAVVVCLGGEHRASQGDVAAVAGGDCSVGCTHHAGASLPRLARAHDRDCACADLVLQMHEIVATRGEGDPAPSFAQQSFVAEVSVEPMALTPRAQPPPPDLSRQHDTLVARSVQLQV